MLHQHRAQHTIHATVQTQQHHCVPGRADAGVVAGGVHFLSLFDSNGNVREGRGRGGEGAET
eukprot:3934811-Rhodomonas_salina.1